MPFSFLKNAYTGFNIFVNILGYDVNPKGKSKNL